MSDIALQVDHVSKYFRIARAKGGAHDPRRERLSWRHDRFHALRDVSFQIEQGKTLGLIGLNGSGKSTLLKILSGVMTPDAGQIHARGRIGALLELGAGFHPELSGLENVYLNGALLGLTTRDVDRLLPEIIAFAELERFMDMPVKHYSSGMNARLGFAVATRLAPEILLMDETFATGDARFQLKALEHVAQMRSRGHTMIIVSHNLEILVELADQVLWLDHGQIRMGGPTREVLSEYRRSRVDSISAERMKTTLGIHSIFDETDPDRAIVRIEQCVFSLGPRTSPSASANQSPSASPENATPLGARTPSSATTPSPAIPAVPSPNAPASTSDIRHLPLDQSHPSHNPQSAIHNPQSAIRNPQSDIPHSSAPLGIEMGATLTLDLTLAHPGPHPDHITVETAWARQGDIKIMAQSRAIVPLSPAASTHCTLQVGPWDLIEGTWRGVLALGAVASEPSVPGTPPDNHHGLPPGYRYYDRLADAAWVQTLTPNPLELPLVTPIPSRWTVQDGKE